jgi:hypothetical protein
MVQCVHSLFRCCLWCCLPLQKDLGSLLDKATRVEKLVTPLAAATGLAAKHQGTTAASLSRTTTDWALLGNHCLLAGQ